VLRIRLLALLIIALLASALAWAQNPLVTISVDANASRHAISAYIYGVADASTSVLQDLNFTVHRYGGNNSSRYNWQINADNRGSDWYFESIAESSATAAQRTDTLISQTRAANAEPMITVPMIDWVAKLGPGRSKLASFSIAKYGAQTGSDWQWMPDAGNGVSQSTGQPITGNDPNDANVPNNVALQQAFVQHTINQWGLANSGGLRYYLMDNEHSIWFETHRDVAPTGATMEQIRDKMIAYGGMIRGLDAGAKIAGPEEFGWSGYLLSGYDIQYGDAHGWGYLPDRAAHGNMDYMPWLLGQLRQHEQNTGQRVLDVFSLHYYPQENEFSSDTSNATQLLRNRSTRSLWDPNYTDTSWINDKVYLIPRMKQWLAAYYPGLQTAITEYNWGAENHINGATAQADVLGIFGREGLDYSARWTTPAASTPTYKAMKMYRNYDGSKSAFGDTSVQATVPNPDQLSAFAAQRTSDGALTLMVINKVLSGNTPIQVNLAHFSAAGTARVWQLTSSNAINHLSDIALSGATLNATVPPQSITLFVIAPGSMVQRAYVSAASGSDSNTAASCSVTSPCRTFAAAATVVSSGGEVIALDSGEYGAVTLTDSISLIGAPGAAAEIAPAAGNGVTMATAGVRAILRGLSIIGAGGSNGISATDGTSLLVDRCVIGNFAAGSGITVTGALRLDVIDSVIRDNGTGINLVSGPRASVSRVKLLGNSAYGIQARGTSASTATAVAVDRTIVMGTGSDNGIAAQSVNASASVKVEVARSTVSKNAIGLTTSSSAGGLSWITLGRSRVSGNATGLSQSGAGSAMRSAGDNTLVDNGLNFSGSLTTVSKM